MVRFLIRVAIFLGTAALGLLVAWILLPGFDIEWAGFLVAMIVFAIAQSLLSPLVSKLAARHAPAVLGGVGLISTFISLLLATVIANGLRIDGLLTWVLATVIVWLVTALGTWLLPLIFLKDRPREQRRARA
ncbi:phage holin family protein [Agromyces sp. ISL-38]|uniref:phage holin family protein n=1 Tax=Agromyces sp. ISL-38 TaxID=2819107 RepID=UPI001BE9BE89|nr:phage holin family protein [Agromyces sp. ISL-38]MBT2497535.1 phage holin family protein [Agromyces sp. ISL-38]